MKVSSGWEALRSWEGRSAGRGGGGDKKIISAHASSQKEFSRLREGRQGENSEGADAGPAVRVQGRKWKALWTPRSH